MPEAQCRQLWEATGSPRGTQSEGVSPHFYEFYLQELNQILTVNIQKEKNTHKKNPKNVEFL